MAANLYPVFGKAPGNTVTPLTHDAAGDVAATKVTPTVAAGEVGLFITGVFCFHTGADNSIDITLHVKPTGGAMGTNTAICLQAGVDATVTPVQMLNTTNMPGLLLLNSTSPVFFLGEGEELGIQIANGTNTEITNVWVTWQKLSA